LAFFVVDEGSELDTRLPFSLDVEVNTRLRLGGMLHLSDERKRLFRARSILGEQSR
jgi:hypothetical protein